MYLSRNELMVLCAGCAVSGRAYQYLSQIAKCICIKLLNVFVSQWVDGAVCRVRCERESRSDGVGGKEGGLWHHPPSPYSPSGSHHLLPRAIRVTVKSSSLTLDGHWESPENWACTQLKKTVWVVIDPGAAAASEGCFSCFSFRAGESQPF